MVSLNKLAEITVSAFSMCPCSQAWGITIKHRTKLYGGSNQANRRWLGAKLYPCKAATRRNGAKRTKNITPNDQAFIGIALLCPQRDQLAEARDMV